MALSLIFLTSCQKESFVPKNVPSDRSQPETLARDTVIWVPEAPEKTTVLGVDQVRTLKQCIFRRCDEYTTPSYTPPCEVAPTDSTLFYHFFPTKGKYWYFKFYGYGGESTIQGFFRGKGVPGGGGTCRFSIDPECYELVIGELYEFDYDFNTHELLGGGVLIGRSTYDTRGCPPDS